MLPKEITVKRSADELRFDLPRRPLGPLRFVGLVPMAFALFFVWMPGGQMLRFLRGLLAGNSSPFEWFFVAFLSLFVLAAMVPFGLGLFIFAGRTRVTLRKDRMVITELAFLARWSRRWKFDTIDRLEIAGAASTGGRPASGLRALCGVSVMFKNGRKTPLVIGYPRDWLQPLLDELRNWMHSRGADVPVTEGTLNQPKTDAPIPTAPRLEKPAGSNIELTNTGWSAEFQVPSRGLFKESYGLLVFGTLWCVIMSVIGMAVVSSHGLHGASPVLLVFLSIGLVLFLTGLHLGTRRWTLRADGSQLHVTMKSALRSREWKWAASEIAEIRVGDSGTKVNERTLEQLQILTRPGNTKTGLLTGRMHDELAWLVTTLQGALGARASESPEAPPRIDPSRRQS